MRMTLNLGLDRVARARGDQERKLGDVCSYCFAKTDLTRGEISLSKRSRGKDRTLTVKCHVCKRLVKEDSEVQFQVPDKAADISSLELEEDLKKTKKPISKKPKIGSKDSEKKLKHGEQEPKVKVDVVFLGNPIMDITVDDSDFKLVNKYGMNEQINQAFLAEPH